MALRALRIQEKLLSRMEHCQDPEAGQKLGRWLISAREFYHMVTGAPRPGVLKEGRKRASAPSMDAILGPSKA